MFLHIEGDDDENNGESCRMGVIIYSLLDMKFCSFCDVVLVYWPLFNKVYLELHY